MPGPSSITSISSRSARTRIAHLAAARVAVGVAGELGDRGGDPRLLEPVEAEQLGDVARALARASRRPRRGAGRRARSPSPIRRHRPARRATTTLTSSRPRSKSRISSEAITSGSRRAGPGSAPRSQPLRSPSECMTSSAAGRQLVVEARTRCEPVAEDARASRPATSCCAAVDDRRRDVADPGVLAARPCGGPRARPRRPRRASGAARRGCARAAPRDRRPARSSRTAVVGGQRRVVAVAEAVGEQDRHARAVARLAPRVAARRLAGHRQREPVDRRARRVRAEPRATTHRALVGRVCRSIVADSRLDRAEPVARAAAGRVAVLERARRRRGCPARGRRRSRRSSALAARLTRRMISPPPPWRTQVRGELGDDDRRLAAAPLVEAEVVGQLARPRGARARRRWDRRRAGGPARSAPCHHAHERPALVARARTSNSPTRRRAPPKPEPEPVPVRVAVA